ncbi:MAG: hypothetical protein V3V61_01055 [Gammaproteobacteria bacterium]
MSLENDLKEMLEYSKTENDINKDSLHYATQFLELSFILPLNTEEYYVDLHPDGDTMIWCRPANKSIIILFSGCGEVSYAFCDFSKKPTEKCRGSFMFGGDYVPRYFLGLLGDVSRAIKSDLNKWGNKNGQ